MRSMLSDEGFYSCSILFQLIRDRYVKMLLDTNGGFRQNRTLLKCGFRPTTNPGGLPEHALARIAKGDGLLLKSVTEQAYRRSHALPSTA
jgi:hypothetical protein